MASRSVPLLPVLLTLAGSVALPGCEGSPSDVESGADQEPFGGKADGLEDLDPAALCDAETWLEPVPVEGNAIMAHAGRAYIFASDGRSWTVVRGGIATTEPIPFPEGIVEMRNVVAEAAPNGRPLVTFRSEDRTFAAFFDGTDFVQVTDLDSAVEAHADARGHIYTADFGGVGLVEYVPDEGPIYRGGLAEQPRLWGVSAQGVVHAFIERRRPSSIHRGSTSNVLVVRSLAPDTLSWTDDADVASNEGYGFSGAHFAAGRDGSLHIAYSLKYGSYTFRSMDAQTWEQRSPSDIISRAEMVDPGGSFGNDTASEVKGSIVSVIALDYDHVTVSLAYNRGSFSIPGIYHLRSCGPFEGSRNTWPAERLSLDGQAFTPLLIAMDETGQTTIVSAKGARQNVVTPTLVDCGDGCLPPLPETPPPSEDVALGECGAAEFSGPMATPVDVEDADHFGHPIVARGDEAALFLPSSGYWLRSSAGEGATVPLPEALADAETLQAHHSGSGRTALSFRRGSEILAAVDEGAPILTPCSVGRQCDVRVAPDGHLWVYDGDLHEQVGDTFEDRGGPPANLGQWDVDADGAVIVASRGSRHGDTYMSFWRLDAGAVGWRPAGELSNEVIDGFAEEIETGFSVGTSVFAADGSFHLFSSAHSVGNGLRNIPQFHVRSADLETWDVVALPPIETLAANEEHVGWRYELAWANSYEQVRYILMTSPTPAYNGWNWNYPSRQLSVVERCLGEDGEPTYANVATVRHAGWNVKGHYAFSETGVASILTREGLTQVR